MIETLLSSQDKAHRGALELFLSQVDKKMESLHSGISELTKSLEFSQKEIDDLSKQVKQLQEDDKANKEKIDRLTTDLKESRQLVKDLETKSNHQEDYNRRNNLQIVGLDEAPNGETWEQTTSLVKKVVEDKLQLPSVDIEYAHRVGQRTSRGHRSIIARFSDREALMRMLLSFGVRKFI